MRLSILKKFITGDYCDVIIPYICRGVCFGVLEKNKNVYAVWTWYSCRDVFHDDFPLTNHIFLYHKNYSSKKVIKFLHHIEAILKIENKTKIYKTQKTYVSLLLLADFWHQEMRLSLLTLLLRYCIIEKKIKFEITKKIKCNMVKETLPAIEVFLSGRNTYNGNKNGWHEQFAGLDYEQSIKYFD